MSVLQYKYEKSRVEIRTCALFAILNRLCPLLIFSTRLSLIMDCNRTTRCEIRYDQVSTIKPSKRRENHVRLQKNAVKKRI